MEKQRINQFIAELQSREVIDGERYITESVYKTVIEILKICPSTEWPSELIQAFLSALDDDNEGEVILEELSNYPEQLLSLAPIAIKSDYRDAKWQIASELGKLQQEPVKNIENLLVDLLADKDEYVRRRALLALADLQSKLTEKYALLAWNSGLEYQGIVALDVLHTINSPLLREYLAKAETSPYKFIRLQAQEITSKLQNLS